MYRNIYHILYAIFMRYFFRNFKILAENCGIRAGYVHQIMKQTCTGTVFCITKYVLYTLQGSDGEASACSYITKCTVQYVYEYVHCVQGSDPGCGGSLPLTW